MKCASETYTCQSSGTCPPSERLSPTSLLPELSVMVWPRLIWVHWMAITSFRPSSLFGVDVMRMQGAASERAAPSVIITWILTHRRVYPRRGRVHMMKLIYNVWFNIALRSFFFIYLYFFFAKDFFFFSNPKESRPRGCGEEVQFGSCTAKTAVLTQLSASVQLFCHVLFCWEAKKKIFNST